MILLDAMNAAQRMNLRTSFLIITFFLAGQLAVSAQGNSSGEFIALNSPSEAHSFCISADGSTIGGAQSYAPSFAAVWRNFEGPVILPDLNPGADGSQVYAINQDGAILVGTSPSSYYQSEAVRWTDADGVVSLQISDELGVTSIPYGISGDGSIVVGVYYSPSISFRAFRWTQSGGTEDLNDLPGGAVASSAQAISLNGSVIVGYSSSASSGMNSSEPCRWTIDSGVSSLGILPGGRAAGLAKAVSADGSVIVGKAINAAGQFEAFRWTNETGMQGLGLFPGGNFSTAIGISSEGDVMIGAADTANEPYLGKPIIWDAKHGIRFLANILIDDLGLTDAVGWTFYNATGISSDGTTIVGIGLNPMGILQSWAAVVPRRFTTCPTDLNGDNITDLADLVVTLSMYASTGPHMSGDVNFDGIVNLEDIALILSSFGSHCAS